jgi:hypothetical protein
MMPALPPLQLSASSSAPSGAKGGDGAFGGSGSGITNGDWNVNFGEGSISTSSTPWVLIAIAAGAWFLKKKA